jgi:hypothetical protein
MLTLLLLLKVSPPLFVIDVGIEIFAIIGSVYGFGFTVSKAFIFKVELPELEEGTEVLLGIKQFGLFSIKHQAGINNLEFNRQMTNGAEAFGLIIKESFAQNKDGVISDSAI